MVAISAAVTNGRAPSNLQGPIMREANLSTNLCAEYKVQDPGRIALTVGNFGMFGYCGPSIIYDPEYGCLFPKDTRHEHLFAASLWIGAVVSGDTLVSIGAEDSPWIREMWPDSCPDGKFTVRSRLNGDPGAISDLDFIAEYTDTLSDSNIVWPDSADGRPHIPLGLKITQRSYAWAQEKAEDFILFDYTIENITGRKLNYVYIGIYVDGDVYSRDPEIGFLDDICGFKRAVPSILGCGFQDTINTAWIADNDGWDASHSCPYDSTAINSVAGVRILRTPSDSLKYSFNWWGTDYHTYDFGPGLAGAGWDPPNHFGNDHGIPYGDRHKYYLLRHEEFDYDQLFTAVNQSSEGWLAPPSNAAQIAIGSDSRFLLSFGPYDINPMDDLPLSFALVMGENFHSDCAAFQNMAAKPYPHFLSEYLNFEDLGRNAVYASWVYDNPGFDTDGDGYRGKYFTCDSDTIYYTGDAVPDWNADALTDLDGPRPGPLPAKYQLYQNSPNPFNPTTTISFELPRREEVALTIYNIMGQLVRKMDIGTKPAGRYSVVWDGNNSAGQPVASGIYFYRIDAGSFTASKKMVLLK